MAIKVKYFGAIAEAAGLEEESIALSELTNAQNDLQAYFQRKYPAIQELTFQVAINQSIGQKADLADGDEIALLPPFAGG